RSSLPRKTARRSGLFEGSRRIGAHRDPSALRAARQDVLDAGRGLREARGGLRSRGRRAQAARVALRLAQATAHVEVDTPGAAGPRSKLTARIRGGTSRLARRGPGSPFPRSPPARSVTPTSRAPDLHVLSHGS